MAVYNGHKVGSQSDLHEGSPVYVMCGAEGWTEGVITEIQQNRVLVTTRQGKNVPTEQFLFYQNRKDYQDSGSGGVSWKVIEEAGCTVERMVPQQMPGDSQMAEVTDLCYLTPLSAATVLQCLQERYKQEVFYTRAGSTLVALNPFTEVTGLYGRQAMQTVRDQATENFPHVYSVADKAYQNMRMNLEGAKVNQCIIVSGESGAGKTVSGKHLMNYLVSMSSHQQTSHYSRNSSGPVALEIEQKILDSNPILEAFGNASTLRNHNSSRFGKYIELHFDTTTHHIVGASIKTYLLEKTRVVFQAPNEHNFHVFYQLLTSQYTGVLNGLFGENLCSVFKVAKCDGRNKENDQSKMCDLEAALTSIGLSQHQKTEIFKVLVGILVLCNLQFVADGEDSETCYLAEEQTDVADKACEILGLPATDLEMTLTHKVITASHARRKSVIHKPCQVSEAENRRNCVARVLYDRLFTWIVDFTNVHIKGTQDSRPTADIGILDIYGFESFEKNSLEQLCINYANEKLHQHFVVHFLRDLQEDYTREGVPWNFTEFSDNHKCLEQLEDRPSVFALIDEECSLNRPSNPVGLAERIAVTLRTGGEQYVTLSKQTKASEPGFVVRHFAGTVTYSTEGILHKNKDDIASELLQFLSRSSSVFVSSLVAGLDVNKPGKKRKTVLCKFKSSMKNLMTTLESCEPHYIRCIKPNARSEAGDLDRLYVLRQLNACGLVETVRICKQAYPARMSYKQFVKHYGLILHHMNHTKNPGNNNKVCINHTPQDVTTGVTYFPDTSLSGTIEGDDFNGSATSEHNNSHTERRYSKRRKGVLMTDHKQVLCATIMETVFSTLYKDNPAHSVQFGRTQIFLMDGQLEKLESVRQWCLSRCAFTIQCTWYRLKARQRRRRQAAITRIQAVIRGWLQRRETEKTKSAFVVIQKSAMTNKPPTSFNENLVLEKNTSQRGQRDKTKGECNIQMCPSEDSTNLESIQLVSDCVAYNEKVIYTPSDTNSCVHKSSNTLLDYPIDLQCTHTCDLVQLFNSVSDIQEDIMGISPQKSLDYKGIVKEALRIPALSESQGIMMPLESLEMKKISTLEYLVKSVSSVMKMEKLRTKRFQLTGVFQGIPYLEAEGGVFSRRRMPRVKVRFHTQVNPVLPGGHLISQRERQCSVTDCL